MDGAKMPMSENRRWDVVESKLDIQSESLNEIKVQLATMQENTQIRIANLEKANEHLAARISQLVLGFIGAVVTAIGTWVGQNIIAK